MKIYDCFTFFNELDLLKIRLEELYDYVDYFVLVEMDKTHSGKEKKFYFEENKKEFQKFLDKIIHIKVNCNIKKGFFEKHPALLKNKIFNSFYNKFDLGGWRRENFQRNSIIRGLNSSKDEDLILVSDVDEIPSPEKFEKAAELLKKEDVKRIGFLQKMFLYYLNGYAQDNWIGTKATTYKKLKEEFNSMPQKLRVRKDFLKRMQLKDVIRLRKGGWHFSYLGNLKSRQKKIESFAEVKKIFMGDDFIKIGKKTTKINYVPINRNFPKYIIRNKDLLKKRGLIK